MPSVVEQCFRDRHEGTQQRQTGQNSPFKRTHFLYQAFLNAFGPDNSDARLMIVASPEMARELGGRAGNVQFRSKIERERVPDFYHSLDCFVTFSYAEGYNMTPLEALACGIPCMVTDSPEMHESPYDRECIHVPASRVVRPETLLGQAFAPSDPSLYFTPPWVHEVSMDDAVDALRAFAADPVPRRATTLSSEFSWRGRIETQVLPFLPEPFGERGDDPAFRRLWRDSRMPVYRARRLHQSNHWSLHAEDDEFILAPRADTRGLRCNAVGAAVWRLCDGEKRFVDIVYELQTGLEGAPDNIVEELDYIVSTMLDHGVVEFRDA
ncbi:MAG: PqqD family peptide modification chaperone [Gammaproteobacteria bacterium]|nr:PqqD family peptide modification chaperone [Gammaproteobacteria bacterium]